MSRFKQKETAEYIRLLLDQVKNLTNRLDSIEEELEKRYTDVPPIPYTGQDNALHFQRHDVVQVSSLNLQERRFFGYRCKPKIRTNVDTDDWWEIDPLLQDKGIWVDVPLNFSIPETEEFVEVFFTGMYLDASNQPQPKYSVFAPHETMIGVTTSYQFPYPPESANPNTYEVQLWNSRYPLVPGNHTPAPQLSMGLITAHNWADNVGGASTYVPQGSKVTVFKSGSYWWFEHAAPEEIVYFELTQDKNIGTSPTQPVLARILLFNGTLWVPTGDAIRVFDSYYNNPGFFTGKAGVDRGWAKLRKRADSTATPDDYELIWMSGPAHVVRFELTQDRNDTGEEEALSAVAKETYLYGHDRLTAGQSMTVWFPTDFFPWALTTGTGVALYNDRKRRYEVVQCDQIGLYATAILASDMCGDSPTLSGFTVTSFWPFSIELDITSAVNSAQHQGQAGDVVKLVFDDSVGAYDVYDVTLKETQMVIDVTWDAANGCWKKQRRLVAVESCEEPQNPEEIICGGVCT